MPGYNPLVVKKGSESRSNLREGAQAREAAQRKPAVPIQVVRDKERVKNAGPEVNLHFRNNNNNRAPVQAQ